MEESLLCSFFEEIYNPSVVYAADRLKTVVLVIFLFCVVLWFFVWAFHPVYFSVQFSIVVISLGEERELVYMLFVHLYVHHACFNFCRFLFLLVLGVWLWFGIMALPGRFEVYFVFSCLMVIHLFSPCIDTQMVGEDHPFVYLTNYKCKSNL